MDDMANLPQREYHQLVADIREIRNRIDALPPWAGEDERYGQHREELFDRHANLERRLTVLSPRARELTCAPAVAAAEVVADVPILATAVRSEQ
jgi:hypothetical protein